MTRHLTLAVKPYAYALSMFASVVAELHPELVGRLPKADEPDEVSER
jgi:hypothetical protein